jgi:hypothetical protein
LADPNPRCIPKWVENWNGNANARNFKLERPRNVFEIAQTPVGSADVDVDVGGLEDTAARFAFVLKMGVFPVLEVLNNNVYHVHQVDTQLPKGAF